jgi:hypothetical protein
VPAANGAELRSLLKDGRFYPQDVALGLRK